MKLSRYEQETIVNYNAGEQTAILYTRDKAVMRKLDTLVADFPDIYKQTGQDGRTRYLRPIPFRSHTSTTASRGRSAPSRGNGQGG